jgi:hypothetical protein
MVVAQENVPELRKRTDTVQVCPVYAQWAVPALLVTCGVAARFNETPLRRFDKYVEKKVDEYIQRRYSVDDYLQYAPAVVAFGLDFMQGVDSRHNLRDRMLLFATSYVITGAVVNSMKGTISVWRPDRSADNAFPSGHTAVAFTGAHLLYKEYKDLSPWIGVGGYAAATATGVLRVVNRRHWVSDVVMGAGIGILSVEAACLMLPVWHRLLGIGNGGERMAFLPSVNTYGVGIGWIYVF